MSKRERAARLHAKHQTALLLKDAQPLDALGAMVKAQAIASAEHDLRARTFGRGWGQYEIRYFEKPRGGGEGWSQEEAWAEVSSEPETEHCWYQAHTDLTWVWWRWLK